MAPFCYELITRLRIHGIHTARLSKNGWFILHVFSKTGSSFDYLKKKKKKASLISTLVTIKYYLLYVAAPGADVLLALQVWQRMVTRRMLTLLMVSELHPHRLSDVDVELGNVSEAGEWLNFANKKWWTRLLMWL